MKYRTKQKERKERKKRINIINLTEILNLRKERIYMSKGYVISLM